MSAAPVAPRGAGKPPGGPGKPAGGPSKHPPIPTEWRIELPDSGAHKDTEFGGCRAIEAGYQRGPVLGQGTYGEVSPRRRAAAGRRLLPAAALRASNSAALLAVACLLF